MKTWVIEPRDPLIVRDGRPFSADVAGARATSLDFPFPSTIAGGVRTRQGLAEQIDFTLPDKSEEARAELANKLQALRQIEVRGPLLVELDAGEAIADWLLPAPADAFWGELKTAEGEVLREKAKLIRLHPLQIPPGAFVNLPDDLPCPVGTWAENGKPFAKPPRFWKSEKYAAWLLDPKEEAEADVAGWGDSGPPKDTRTHVGILPDSQTALDGALYQTRGLEFTRQQKRNHPFNPSRLALAVWTAADKLKGLRPFGGERRLTHWRESNQSAEEHFKACKTAVLGKIKQQRDGQTYHCRVLLLTPAHFTSGYSRDWTLGQTDLQVELQAAAINRPQVVSGWDFDRTKSNHGQAKPSKRLAPAGSVYFLKLTGEEKAVDAWCEKVWLRSVSDGEQDQRDGFGLAVLGTWATLEVK
jgi:CRISPR-associated protein Cmr3